MIRRFHTFARPYLGAYLAGFVLLLATNGLSLWIPWLLRDAIHLMESEAGLASVAEVAGWIVAVALAQSVVRTMSRLRILGASRRVVYDIRNAFFAHLQSLSASFYDRHRTGDIMSRGVNDVRLIQSFYGPGLMNLLNTAIVYVAVLTLMLQIDVRLTLISFLLFPLLFFAVNRISRHVYARSLAVQEQLAALSNRAQENLSGIQQVKTYVQEERETAAFRDLCDGFRRRSLSMAVVRGVMLSVIGITSGLGALLVLFVGGRHVIEGRITFGDFVAFNAYLGLLTGPTIALGWIINVFQRGVGAMQRVDEFLCERPDVEPADVDGATPEPVHGDIEIRGLSFDYGGENGGTSSLRDIHLHIPRGSWVALVGPVGSGKSTLANLLARFYPVPRGTVFIAGQDINDIPVARLRRSLGYVPQEAFLFSRTIRHNVSFRDPEAADGEVARALRMSHLARDVEGFPEGLETLVGERGVTLSGGQRQRATLARAMVGDPPILILDDALSSVDADTEKAILEGFANRVRDRTLIFISHRLSALSTMDRIVVLDHGRIVEEGTHDDLLSRDGLYAKLLRRRRLEQRLDDA